MFGIWRIDVCRSALNVHCYLFIVSWSCGSQLVLRVELVVLCLIVWFGFACGLDAVMSCFDVMCCALWFFFASRLSLRFLRPLISLVCFKTKGDTTARRIC